MTCTVKSI